MDMHSKMTVLEENLAVSYKTKYSLTNDPVITLQGIWANEVKMYGYTKPYT